MPRTQGRTHARAHGRALVVAVAGASLLLAACGDEGSDTAAPDVVDTDVVATVTDEATTVVTGEVTDEVTDTVTDESTVTDTETVVETQTETVDADDGSAVDAGDEDGGIDASTEPDTRDATGEPVTLVDVRVGSHEEYDRVVWEFAGDGTPGWRAEYVDDPTRQGSGQPVDLEGDGTLSVAIDGTALPTDAPAGVTPYDGAQRVAAASFETITEVLVGNWFEGTYDAFVGVEGEQPFRVRLFEDPTRVVLDVEN
ncbi:AMIN-like domain-containing (lipo)protein [Aquipuribacter nitratireducens]|uniref:AMIN-like domain-containing protein n=1 Tax=Aquipuribacter nitratireducens TaxID=650104 RepID=A0ABW0GPJ4_9MICO